MDPSFRIPRPLRPLVVIVVAAFAAPAPASDPLLRWLFDLGDYEAAIVEADRELAGSPDDAETLFMRGVAAARLGRPEPAERDLRRVLELAPERPRARTALADLLLARAKEADADTARALSAEAAALLEEERRFGDVSRGTLIARARALEGAGRYGEAAELLETLLDGTGPPDEKLIHTVADLYRQLGRHDLVLERLARLDPPSRETAVRIFNACVQLYRSGDDGAVIEALPRAIEARPDAAPFHRLLGLALLRAGREQEALKSLGRFAELAPDDPEAEKIRARIRGGG